MNDPAEVLADRQAETLDVHPDPDVAGLGHCKDAPHLRCVAQQVVGLPVGSITVERVPALVCVNDPTYHSWGAVLIPGHKTTGLQLFPGGITFLAQQLLIVAAEARANGFLGIPWAAVVEHTFLKQFRTWRPLAPDEADRVAGLLAAMHA